MAVPIQSADSAGPGQTEPGRILVPDAPALVAGAGRAALLLPDGEFVIGSSDQVAARLNEPDFAVLGPPLLVHAPATLRRLGLRAMSTYDLLELFAFVLPARSA